MAFWLKNAGCCFLRCVRALLLSILVVLLSGVIFENNLVYHPVKYPAGNWNPTQFPFEDILFTSADGTSLHGWYVPHKAGKKHYGTVLFCHGNAGNLASRTEIIELLHNGGFSLFIFDYRGYGKSQGKPNEKGVLADAEAARVWLSKKEKIAQKEIIVMGRSIGGAVAVHLATAGAKGLVLESTFDSLPRAAKIHYPFLPTRILMSNRFDSISKIKKYQGPLLQSHGRQDQIVPLILGKKLHQNAPGKKEWFEFAGGHNDARTQDYRKKLLTFLQAL